MNIIETWLFLIGEPNRAKKLRLRVDTLSSTNPDEAPQCPTTVLFGSKVSQQLYADPKTRPALDGWDTGAVSKGDIRRWCLEVEKGNYRGRRFVPPIALPISSAA